MGRWRETRWTDLSIRASTSHIHPCWLETPKRSPSVPVQTSLHLRAANQGVAASSRVSGGLPMKIQQPIITDSTLCHQPIVFSSGLLHCPDTLLFIYSSYGHSACSLKASLCAWDLRNFIHIAHVTVAPNPSLVVIHRQSVILATPSDPRRLSIIQASPRACRAQDEALRYFKPFPIISSHLHLHTRPSCRLHPPIHPTRRHRDLPASRHVLKTSSGLPIPVDNYTMRRRNSLARKRSKVYR